MTYTKYGKYNKDDHAPVECQEGDTCEVCDILYCASDHDQYCEFVTRQQKKENPINDTKNKE